MLFAYFFSSISSFEVLFRQLLTSTISSQKGAHNKLHALTKRNIRYSYDGGTSPSLRLVSRPIYQPRFHIRKGRALHVRNRWIDDSINCLQVRTVESIAEVDGLHICAGLDDKFRRDSYFTPRVTCVVVYAWVQ